MYTFFVFSSNFKQSKRFAEGAKKKVALPELESKIGVTPDKILTELDKTVFLDTYREEINKKKRNETHTAPHPVRGKTKSTIRKAKETSSTSSAAHVSNTHHKPKPSIIPKPVPDHHSIPRHNESELVPSPAPRSKLKMPLINSAPANPAVDGTQHVWFSSPKVIPSNKIPLGPEREATSIQSKPPVKPLLNTLYPNSNAYSVPKQPLLPGSLSQNSMNQAENIPVVRNNVPPSPMQPENPGLLRQGRPMVNNPYRGSLVRNQNYLTQGDTRRPGPQRSDYQRQPLSRPAPAPPRSPPNVPQWAGGQAFQNGRASMVPNMFGQSSPVAAPSYGRFYSAPGRYGSEQFDIGRKKREIEGGRSAPNKAGLSLSRGKRQNAVWYNTRTYPQSYTRNKIQPVAASNPYLTRAQTLYPGAVNQGGAGTYDIKYEQPATAPQNYGPYGAYPHRPSTMTADARGSITQGQYVSQQKVPGDTGMDTPSWGAQTRNGPSSNSVASPQALKGPSVAQNINAVKQKEILARQKQMQAQAQYAASKPATAADRKIPPSRKPASLDTTHAQRTETASKPGAKTKTPNKQEQPHTKKTLTQKMNEMTAKPPKKPTKIASLKAQDLGSSVEQKHLAPMFGGDLLLTAGTLSLLQHFNQYAKPATTLNSVKVWITNTFLQSLEC